MIGWINSWRHKRRQRALALAWCGNQTIAEHLLRESRSGTGGRNNINFYKHMANCWLEQSRKPENRCRETQTAPLHGSISPPDAVSCKVRRLISQMPMQQRMILSLVDVARLSYSETAAVMKLSVFDVQYSVVTARRYLLKEMHQDIHTHNAMESMNFTNIDKAG